MQRPACIVPLVSLALMAGNFFTPHAEAFAQFKKASDLISTSATGVGAGHEVTVMLTHDIAPGGSFIIDFRGASAFGVTDGFSYSDVDFAVATSSGSDFLEYSLASSTTASTSAVSVITGDNGSVAITLGSDESLRVLAGSIVRIRLGPTARYEYSGSWPVLNPSVPGVALVQLHTENAPGDVVDRADVVDYILDPIGLSSGVEGRETIMSNPLPKGLLPGNTKKVYLSMETDLPAFCRYSSASTTPYMSRPTSQQFKGQNANRHHYLIIDTADDQHYTFFVRCYTQYGKMENTSDLVIDFEIGVQPNEPRPPAPPPKPAGSENGSGAGGGNKQFQSGVVVAGRAFPGAAVTVLMDGKDYAKPSVNSNGEWKTETKQLDRGVYSFSVFATDGSGLTTARYNATLSVNPNTTNSIGPVLMSPTLSAPGNRIEPGQRTTISGRAIAGEVVQVVVLTPSDPLQMPLVTASTTARGDGSYSISLPTEAFSKGTYNVKGQSIVKGKGTSLFSSDYFLGIGEAPKGAGKGRSDLNRDGRVNIADFSILLSHWNQAYPSADLNGNGKVDIADFSILLSAWTG